MTRFATHSKNALAMLAAMLLFSLAAYAESATLKEQLDRCEQLEHGQPEQAIELIEPIIAELDAQQQPFERIRAVGCRAWSLGVLGQLEQKQRDLEEIKQLLALLTEPEQQSQSLRLIATLKHRSGETVESIEALKQALEIAQNNDLTDDLIPLYTNLGIIHSEAKNHALAIEHYELALELAEQQGNIQMRLPILYNLGLTYRGADQLDKAIEAFEQLLEPLEAPGMEIRLASLLSVLGSIYREQGRLEQAQANYERSAALHAELNNPAERSALLIDLSYMALEQDRLQTALDYSDEALSTARESDYSMSIRGALQARARVLETAGRADEALELLREFNQLNEEHLIEQQRSELNELQAQIGYEQQALELAELRTQQQQQQHDLSQQRLLLWAGAIIAILILLIVIAALFWQRLKHRELTQLSRTDQLTGLPNRHRIMNFLSEAIHSDNADRYVLLLLDLDYFKQINDEHGHDAGDRALFEVAEEMRAFANNHQVDIGRWGGEEFLILFQADRPEDAVQLTTELLDRVASIRGEADIRLTASAGFAPLSSLQQLPDQRIWEPALLIADQLLFRAKKAGRNGFFGVWPTSYSARIQPHHLDDAIESGVYRLLQRSA